MQRSRHLGPTSQKISSIGLGCWQFAGDSGRLSGHWKPIPETVADAIVSISLAQGVNWFDSAEAYGDGYSELTLARALSRADANQGEIVIATKWWPRERNAAHMLESFTAREACLGGWPVGLYQIHHPDSESTLEEEISVLSRLVESGKVKAIGLCNYSAQALDQACRIATSLGTPIASIQARYSLMNRSLELNGVLDVADKHNLTVIAWAPLEQGLLTGRLHHEPKSIDALSKGRRDALGPDLERLEQTRPLIQMLHEIAQHHDATPAQVALSWLINFHGNRVVAIPGASTPVQAEENAGAINLHLTASELSDLDKITRPSFALRGKARIRKVLRITKGMFR